MKTFYTTIIGLFISAFSFSQINVSHLERDSVFDLYPNPAVEYFTIQLNSNLPQVISIYNLQGELLQKLNIKNQDVVVLPIRHYEKGIYIVEVRRKKDAYIQTLAVR